MGCGMTSSLLCPGLGEPVSTRGFTHGAQGRESRPVCASRWTTRDTAADPTQSLWPEHGHTRTSVWNEQFAGQGQGRDGMLAHQSRQAPCKTERQTSIRTVSHSAGVP